MIESHPDTLHDFSPTIVADVYDTIFAPEKWHAIFEEIGNRARCTSFLYGRVDYAGNVQIFAKNNFDDDRLDHLIKHYTTLDANPVMGLFDRCNVGSLFRISDYFSARQWERLDVAHDVFIPQSFHFSLCTTVAKDSRHVAPLSILRSKHQGDFADRELALFQSLMRHMVRALRAYEEIDALRQHREGLEDTLDFLGCGVVLLDATGEVMFLNSAARALIDRKDGLALERRQLTAILEPDRSRLAALAGRAVAADPSIRRGGAMTLSRRVGMGPLPCLAIPINEASGRQHFCKAPAAMLIFRKDDARLGEQTEALKGIYGLSRRQAELVSLLLMGKSLPVIGRQLGISQETARTHLRRAFAKIGVTNQLDLVGLIASGPLGLSRSSAE